MLLQCLDLLTQISIPINHAAIAESYIICLFSYLQQLIISCFILRLNIKESSRDFSVLSQFLISWSMETILFFQLSVQLSLKTHILCLQSLLLILKSCQFGRCNIQAFSSSSQIEFLLLAHLGQVRISLSSFCQIVINCSHSLLWVLTFSFSIVAQLLKSLDLVYIFSLFIFKLLNLVSHVVDFLSQGVTVVWLASQISLSVVDFNVLSVYLLSVSSNFLLDVIILSVFLIQ